MPARQPRLTRWVLLVALLVLPLAAVPAAAEGLFNPTRFTLANGLEVLVVEDHRAPVVSHMVWYKVGAADEPDGKSGIAHFLEHLMFKGTRNRPAGEFSRIVARIGGRENASTSQDYTNYYQLVAADRLEQVMELEADRMANLQLSEEDVRTELQVVLEERRQRVDSSPGALLGEQVRAVQYLRHPYRVPVIGWEAEIRQLDREDAIAFYRRYYAPNNAVLIVTGDVEPEQVRALAERHYGPIARVDVPERARPLEPEQLVARRVEMADPRVAQPTWQRTYLAPSRRAGESRHAVPLQVLSHILGGSETSRLRRRLMTEGQVATSVGSGYSSFSYDETLFYLYGTPADGVGVAEMEAAVDAILAEVVRDGVTPEEMERSRTALLAQVYYARDNLTSAPYILGDALTSGLDVDAVETWPQQVEQVTAEQVQEAARYVFDARRSVTAVLLPAKPAG